MGHRGEVSPATPLQDPGNWQDLDGVPKVPWRILGSWFLGGVEQKLLDDKSANKKVGVQLLFFWGLFLIYQLWCFFGEEH